MTPELERKYEEYQECIELFNSRIGILCKLQLDGLFVKSEPEYGWGKNSFKLKKKQLFIPICCFIEEKISPYGVRGQNYYYFYCKLFVCGENGNEYCYICWDLAYNKEPNIVKDSIMSTMIPLEWCKTKERNLGTKYQEIKDKNENR